MKIAYVVKAFPRLSETFILTELLALERLGHEVIVFSRHAVDDPAPHEHVGDLDAEVVTLSGYLKEDLWRCFEDHRELARRHPERHDLSQTKALSHRSREEMRYWLAAGPVARRVLAEGCQLIHAHFATGSASVARYASTIAGLPYTCTAHAKDIYTVDVDLEVLRGRLDDAARVVTVSDYNVNYLADRAPQARVERIYNGIDLDRFAVRRERPRSNPPTVLFLGRMVEKKGIPHLLSAIAELDRRGTAVRCELVGEGPVEPELRAQVSSLGIDRVVDFLGPKSQQEVLSRHLPQASVFVLPAIVAENGDRDGLPTTILEAMACGVPVISTDVTGIPEAVVDGVTGSCVPQSDPLALANAIEATLGDPSATRNQVQAARQHIEKFFDSSKNALTLGQLFERVARARQAISS